MSIFTSFNNKTFIQESENQQTFQKIKTVSPSIGIAIQNPFLHLNASLNIDIV